MTEWPEHEKLKALGGDNDTIGDFLEWLWERGIRFTRWDTHYRERPCSRPSGQQRQAVDEVNSLRELAATFAGAEPPDPLPRVDMPLHNPDCPECAGAGYVTYQAGEEFVEAVPESRGGSLTARWLADYFEIDYDRLMDEKDRMLAEIRAANDAADAKKVKRKVKSG